MSTRNLAGERRIFKQERQRMATVLPLMKMKLRKQSGAGKGKFIVQNLVSRRKKWGGGKVARLKRLIIKMCMPGQIMET